jgi:hypothetical protein
MGAGAAPGLPCGRRKKSTIYKQRMKAERGGGNKDGKGLGEVMIIKRNEGDDRWQTADGRFVWREGRDVSWVR